MEKYSKTKMQQTLASSLLTGYPSIQLLEETISSAANGNYYAATRLYLWYVSCRRPEGGYELDARRMIDNAIDELFE